MDSGSGPKNCCPKKAPGLYGHGGITNTDRGDWWEGFVEAPDRSGHGGRPSLGVRPQPPLPLLLWGQRLEALEHARVEKVTSDGKKVQRTAREDVAGGAHPGGRADPPAHEGDAAPGTAPGEKDQPGADGENPARTSPTSPASRSGPTCTSQLRKA